MAKSNGELSESNNNIRENGGNIWVFHFVLTHTHTHTHTHIYIYTYIYINI